MQSAATQRILADDRRLRAAKLAQMKAAGHVDEIVVMYWPDRAMAEVRGFFLPHNRFGEKYSAKNLVEYMRQEYGSGKLRRLAVETIQGRKVETFAVLSA